MKKWISITLSVIMMMAVLAAPALAASASFEYKLVLTDGSGKEITNVSALKPGETVNVSIRLNRTDIDESYEAYGIEMTLETKGLSYKGNGKAFDGAMDVTSKKQTVAGTETVSFRYMDLEKQGMSVSNKLEVGTCSYTVTESGASLRLSVGIVYITGSDKEYVPVPGGDSCEHEHTEVRYTDNKDGTHDVETVCKDCGAVISVKAEKCTYTEKVTKKAGCETEGEKTFTCTKCGHSYKETIKAAGHDIVTDAAEKATCTTDGKTEGSHCKTCGKEIKKQETIKAEGHKWDEGKVTKEATETEEGEKEYTCTVCGATRTEKIPAKGEEKPEEPEKPGKPENPEEPEKPTPEKPEDTKKPESTKPSDNGKSDPGTGDNGFIIIYAAMAVIAAVGAGFIILMKKKHA